MRYLEQAIRVLLPVHKRIELKEKAYYVIINPEKMASKKKQAAKAKYENASGDVQHDYSSGFYSSDNAEEENQHQNSGRLSKQA